MLKFLNKQDLISQRSNSHTRACHWDLRSFSQIEERRDDANDYCCLISRVLTGARFLATCLHRAQFSSSSCSPFFLSLLSWYANSCFRLTKLFSISVYWCISALSRMYSLRKYYRCSICVCIVTGHSRASLSSSRSIATGTRLSAARNEI